MLACDPAPADEIGDAEEPTFTAWDSAGIEIVENHAPEHAPDEFWIVDTVPEFVLGGANEPGTPADTPAGLVWSVVGLARLSDGRVAVLSSEQKQLFLFEPTGELSRTIGREGRGPGEFIYPERLQYFPPDTLEVWDYGMTSTIRFDSGGGGPRRTVGRLRQAARSRSLGRTHLASAPGRVSGRGGRPPTRVFSARKRGFRGPDSP